MIEWLKRLIHGKYLDKISVLEGDNQYLSLGVDSLKDALQAKKDEIKKLEELVHDIESEYLQYKPRVLEMIDRDFHVNVLATDNEPKVYVAIKPFKVMEDYDLMTDSLQLHMRTTLGVSRIIGITKEENERNKHGMFAVLAKGVADKVYEEVMKNEGWR